MSELEMPVLIALFILAGSVAGYMAGLLGIGGGAILVPVLFQTFIFPNNIPDIIKIGEPKPSSVTQMIAKIKK